MTLHSKAARVAAAMAFTLGLGVGASAEAGDIVIRQAWSPTVASMARTRAIYMAIENRGEAARRLVGAKVEGYAMAHLHLSAIVDGVTTMSRVDALDLPPGGAVVFAPGGLHVMAMKPMEAPEAGAALEVSISFENGETISVSAAQMSMSEGLRLMREQDDGS